MSETSPQAVNRLLAALPDAEYQHLIPHREHVSLSFKQVLYEVGELIEYIYSPHRGMISALSTMADGSMVEVGLVGKDGISEVSPPLWETASQPQTQRCR